MHTTIRMTHPTVIVEAPASAFLSDISTMLSVLLEGYMILIVLSILCERYVPSTQQGNHI